MHPARERSEGDIRVFCMEPSLHNFANLVLTRDAFFAGTPSNVQWCACRGAARPVTRRASPCLALRPKLAGSMLAERSSEHGGC